ncbi:hypothetical protein GPS59_16730 [Acinetobacter haemolyticus]|nr:hypothetical protein [Acinetobacter haemolyticus]NAR55558.1 hypothetical protein [Acinetobacter haemolyticus]
MTNISKNLCAIKSSEFKTGQCKHCLISTDFELSADADFIAGDVVVLTGVCRNFHSDDLFEIQRRFTNTLRVIKSKNHKLLVSDNEIRHATPVELQQNRRVNKIILDDDVGDDSHLENNISPLCKSYSNDEQIHLSKALDAQKEVS